MRAARPLVWLYLALSEEGRVLGAAALVVGMLGVEVQQTSTYLLWSALTGALLASLLLRRPLSLQGRAKLEVAAPRRVTVGDELRFTLALINESDRSFDATRLRGPMLPWDGRYQGGPPPDQPLDAGARVEARVGVRFSERGEHHLESFTAAALVPLGLAQGALIESPSCRVMVVPRIAPLRSLRTPRVDRHQPGGVALASRTGESMDLLGVRPYRPGDPVRDLHARTSARRGAPHVREYQQEYFSRFGVILDTEVTDPQAFEAAISLAAGVVAHLSRGEGLIDLLVCGDQLHALTLGRSLGQLEQALDLLACARPGDPFDPQRIDPLLQPYLERLSCVFVIWLTDDPARRAFSAQLARRVACRSLVVSARPGASSEAMQAVSVAQIERGEPLVV